MLFYLWLMTCNFISKKLNGNKVGTKIFLYYVKLLECIWLLKTLTGKLNVLVIPMNNLKLNCNTVTECTMV